MLFDMTGIFRRGVLCSRNFGVSEGIMRTRGEGGGAKGGRMEYHEFPSEIRCLKLPKNFSNESFGVSKSFWSGKNLCISGVCHNLPSKIF